MTSSNVMYKTLLSKELGEIIHFIQMLTPNGFKIPKCDNKIDKANVLGYLMGHWDRVQLKRPKMKCMKTLHEICWDEIMINVPINVLRVASAEWTFNICFPKWLRKSPVPIQYEVPCDYDEYNIFAYPEVNVHRNEIEPRLIDPSHCLTNMRVHATTKSIFNRNCEAFKAVSKYNNSILSAGLVHEPLLDKQSVPFAQQVFSKMVSDAMTTLGYHNEAKLVTHVRNWFDACNERGLTVEKRIEYLIDIHNYFMEFYEPKTYPMSCSHVKGLPTTTFQSILQNVSLRIILNLLSRNKTYNQRAVSTLSVESFFSDLSAMARSNSGIPLTADIPQYLAKVTQINTIKHDLSKYVNGISDNLFESFMKL